MVFLYPGCGGRIRTDDLQVMGLASCQLLYPAIIQISDIGFQISDIRYPKSDLWAHMDSNHGPRPYQGRALAN